MENNELVSILNAYFNWHRSRMCCFVGMLLSLIKVRTVNLTELACGFTSTAQLDSRYKRTPNDRHRIMEKLPTSTYG